MHEKKPNDDLSGRDDLLRARLQDVSLPPSLTSRLKSIPNTTKAQAGDQNDEHIVVRPDRTRPNQIGQDRNVGRSRQSLILAGAIGCAVALSIFAMFVVQPWKTVSPIPTERLSGLTDHVLDEAIASGGRVVNPDREVMISSEEIERQIAIQVANGLAERSDLRFSPATTTAIPRGISRSEVAVPPENWEWLVASLFLAAEYQANASRTSDFPRPVYQLIAEKFPESDWAEAAQDRLASSTVPFDPNVN